MGVVKLLFEHTGIYRVNVNQTFGDLKLSCLCLACKRKFPTIVKLLLQHPEIDVNLRDSTGKSAMMYALNSPNIEILEFLAKEKNVKINQLNHNGVNIFMYSCSNGCLNLVKILLSRVDLDINLKCVSGFADTGLMRACMRGHVEIVKLLLENENIDINLTNISGENAFQIAERNHRGNICSLLSEFQR